MDQIKIIINDKQYIYKKNISLLDVSKDFQHEFKFPILAAYVDNRLTELDKEIDYDCTIRFIDVLDRTGNKIYQKTLSYILIYAMYLLYGLDGKVKIRYSIDKSILIETDFVITENDINKIKDKMKEIIDRKIPIERKYVNRIDAIEYFEKLGDIVKKETLKYNTNTYIKLYKLENIYNYFYTVMPINTDRITSFDLTFVDDNSFVLQFPVVHLNGEIPNYVKHDKMINVFKEYDDYRKKIKVNSVADLNKLVSERKIEGVIKLDEVISNQKLLEIAKEISQRKNEVKLVLIAGPSSSGKTTTSKKLSMFLKTFGINPKPLSIDDYFKNREDTPKDADGNYDFESISALQIDLFNEHLSKLLNNEEVHVPTFNFIDGKSEYKGNIIKLEENDILIVEGLHALNDELTKTIPNNMKYKMYVAELTNLNIDDQNVVSTSDVRLLRRIVRDARTRGYQAEQTIASWESVRKGEEKYIFPFQNSVDKVYNTALIYEIGVLKLYVTPLLYDISNDSPYYEEAKRLIDFLKMFLVIPSDAIPADSILREFIGNSFFE